MKPIPFKRHLAVFVGDDFVGCSQLLVDNEIATICALTTFRDQITVGRAQV